MRKNGKFITFEGAEGSGKSTQCAILAKKLRATGVNVLVTREPGGTRVGESLRRILRTARLNEPVDPHAELLLFSASRAQLVRNVINPALENGTWVLCDRFMDSTTAYQGFGRGIPLKHVMMAHRISVGGTLPDLTILLDLPVEKGLLRMRSRNGKKGVGHDRFEMEEIAFHTKVLRGYRKLAKTNRRRFIVVSSRGTEDETARRIWKVVKRRFSSELQPHNDV